MPFKGWREVAWRDVDAGTLIKTTDDREWIVRSEWNGERVMLAQDVSKSLMRRIYGPVVPVPLTDGDKKVRAWLASDGGPTTAPTLAEQVGPHEYQPGNGGGCWFADCKAAESDPIHTPPSFAVEPVVQSGPITKTLHAMTPGMADPCQPIGCDNGVHRPGCTFATVDAAEPTSVRRATIDGSEPAPDADRPKFGPPGGSQTAAERIRGEAQDDEGRAVAHLAAHFPDAELVAVEDAVDGIMVPRQLDDLALRSHLFLMHGKFYDDRDVERPELEAAHRQYHDAGAGHRHVDRTPA